MKRFATRALHKSIRLLMKILGRSSLLTLASVSVEGRSHYCMHCIIVVSIPKLPPHPIPLPDPPSSPPFTENH